MKPKKTTRLAFAPDARGNFHRAPDLADLPHRHNPIIRGIVFASDVRRTIAEAYAALSRIDLTAAGTPLRPLLLGTAKGKLAWLLADVFNETPGAEPVGAPFRAVAGLPEEVAVLDVTTRAVTLRERIHVGGGIGVAQDAEGDSFGAELTALCCAVAHLNAKVGS